MNLRILSSPRADAKESMQNAQTYLEWSDSARLLDSLNGLDDWKQREQTDLYDYQIIRARLQKLRVGRVTKDDRRLLFILNEGIHGNTGGMGNPALYSRANFGTKHLVNDYIDEIAAALRYIAQNETPNISFEEKLNFFHRASHCFGRTALMLSGGAALGHFHLGVIKTLVEQNLLPKVISGASAGSLFAAMLGTNTRDRLEEFFKVENLVTGVKEEASLLRRIWRTSYKKVDNSNFTTIVEKLVADLTFEEAYRLTGIYTNITVSPAERLQKARLLNAISSPNVTIRSAVRASCAVPGLFPPVMLEAKEQDGSIKPYLPLRRWIDGSFSDDLPAKRLARMFGVNHYIVSLTNPLAIPFTRDPSKASELRLAISRLLKAFLHEYSAVGSKLNRRLLKRLPRIEALLSLYFSVLAQNYTGDINIIYKSWMNDPRRLLTLLTPDELMEMIREGERSTWPKVEAIRSTTKIGRVLDDILDDYEQREMRLAVEGIRHRKYQQQRIDFKARSLAEEQRSAG